ncbi:putative periplasmic protein (DUF2271) [Treponema sp. JC4]|uniref:DUF2271 domain-containing protein n=1 Tax=Treponema sp. JC4 TaxID=1124982 RepID=UPI00025B0D3F|nr:DUF2271 domain-containing protein [Treponema sp. JC4]EID86061.1 putative periplasmic protein (DUF2271) [Treponema sp. JC4]
MKKFISAILILFSFAGAFAKEISVKVSPGEHWKEKREPQVAVWLEDEKGNYIRTLYVTERASHKSWIFGPKEGRPESLPVWYGASKNESASDKVTVSHNLDAVTGATPKSALTLTAQIEVRDYIIKAEFNNSFDYNDFYTKKTSGVNGQPSVVYTAKIPAELAPGQEITLEFEGTGSLTGEDGKINKSTENLTTAKKIVKAVTVKLN